MEVMKTSTDPPGSVGHEGPRAFDDTGARHKAHPHHSGNRRTSRMCPFSRRTSPISAHSDDACTGGHDLTRTRQYSWPADNTTASRAEILSLRYSCERLCRLTSASGPALARNSTP